MISNIRATFFFTLFILVENQIYLYDTQDGLAVEYYDCILIESLSYCLRPYQPFDLNRDIDSWSCENNGGKKHFFSDLRSQKINISMISHKWKSSIERVEQYSRFLQNSSQMNAYLCQCIQSSSFGKNCEYQLPIGNTFEQTIDSYVYMKNKNPEEVHIHGDIVCYETLRCDSGLLCLDWREICDGVQQCMYGYDEENCDLLEMNICDDDEYRCMNGMCIPDYYFLDGEFDCLDWSDEMQYKESVSCAMESASSHCDDHMCPPTEWSCGDGQCIPDRKTPSRNIKIATCHSRRDQYFMCEIYPFPMRWTMPNGRCTNYTKYRTPLLFNGTKEEQCESFLRCVLSSLDTDCPCSRNFSCTEQLARVCSWPDIPYPESAVMAPYMFFYYDRIQSRGARLPDWILINGTVKWQGSIVSVSLEVFDYQGEWNVREITENIFCNSRENLSRLDNVNSSHQCHQSNESIDLCNEWNRCMSITRIRDGFSNCLNIHDELKQFDIDKSCSRVRRHRFRCSSIQPTCLSVMALGNMEAHCNNKFDELWFGTNPKLSAMDCNDRRKDGCSLLRQYIEQSWISINHSAILPESQIRFRLLCDTFWHLESGKDENMNECRQWWICASNQWQCRTGQCLDQEWVADNEWDCADGSDEEYYFQRTIAHVQEQIESSFISANQSYLLVNNCLQDSTMLCLLPSILSQTFSCVNQSQIGDSKVDCAGAIDERNTFQDCSQSSMLGNNFRCLSTNSCIPYNLHCHDEYRCSNRTDDEHWCSRQQKPPNCEGKRDFVCFDGWCVSNSRCNGHLDCPFGEDEYMCDYMSLNAPKIIPYREEKQLRAELTQATFQLFRFPTHANITLSNPNATVRARPIVNGSLNRSISNPLAAYLCNRGIGILSSNQSIVCFCPPQYYGEKCQYHADRLLVLLHLNLSESIYTTESDPTIVVKLIVLFLFNNQILMTHQFHVRPALEITRIQKKMVHFLYSHASTSRQHRNTRFTNRSDIIDSQPYSIRIEAYENHRLHRPSLIAVWQYPIDFDQLPVYRFSKVLHLIKSANNLNPCSNNSCYENEECQPLMNNPTQHICLFKSNFTASNLSVADRDCINSYCTFNALCKPNYRGLLRGSSLPYCICSLNRYGDRCDLEHEICQSNPCLHGGSCFPTARLDKVTCLCTKEYNGPKCEFPKPYIRLSLNESLHYAGAVVQYFSIDAISLDLMLVHQQVYRSLPRLIEYYHDRRQAPSIILAKLYSSYEDHSPDFYLLSVQLDVTSIEGQSEMSNITQCPDIHTLSKDRSPIRYHHICRNKSNLLCFYDDVYLCICADNHTRVECFRYDRELDRCSHCVTGSRCLRGDHIRSNDFLCLCPPCYSGEQCQFSSNSFTITLDQLFYTDLISINQQRTVYLLVVFAVLGFFLAIPNNLFSFVTFRQRSCLGNGIGHYLLYLSIINQISLGLFVARLIHIVVNITSTHSASNLDNILCKMLNYLLLSSSRMVFWFSSLIAIERIYTTLVLNGQWLKQPHIARRLIVFSTITILLSTVYEVLFYKSLLIVNTTQRSMCIFESPMTHRSLWMAYHLFISTLHSLVPFLINLCSTIIISYVVVKKKMNTLRAKRDDQTNQSALMNIVHRLRFILDVLSEKKELIIGPGITLIPQLFSLPLFISSFTLNCQNIENSWLRYLIITSYWASFTPQLISFFLYISPSSFYSKEWRKTKMGQWINTRFQHHQSTIKTMTFSVLSTKREITNIRH